MRQRLGFRPRAVFLFELVEPAIHVSRIPSKMTTAAETNRHRKRLGVTVKLNSQSVGSLTEETPKIGAGQKSVRKISLTHD